MMQTAVMGTKYRSGFHFIFDLRINLDMISQVPAGRALSAERTGKSLCEAHQQVALRSGTVRHLHINMQM